MTSPVSPPLYGAQSELEKSLNSWEAEITDENRQEAKLRIENFLNDESKNTLDLSFLSLTSLPPIFNTDPFIKRLTTLYAGANQLASLPAEIGGLQALRRLYISHNNTMTGVPREIFDLPSGCEITLDGVGLSEAVLARL